MKYGVRAAKYIAISGMLAAAGIAACSSDDSNTLQGGSGNDAGTTTPDSGSVAQGNDSGGAVGNNDSGGTPGGDDDSGSVVVGGDDSGSPTDAGSDAAKTTGTDSGTDAGATPFCKGQTGLDFCQDFDEPTSLSLDAGPGSTWSSIVTSLTELAISSTESVSGADSLHVTLPLVSVGGDQSAKVVEMITPTAGVSQAIYEFDMYLDQMPNGGGFATDFQFLDTAGGSDQYGFRISIFGDADGGLASANLEHNHPTLGGNDDITPITLTMHTWTHVKMSVAYSALADDAGDNAAFSLYLNKSATPALTANYAAPFAKAAFARFAAGVVYAFDANNKTFGIYYDNFTLKLQ